MTNALWDNFIVHYRLLEKILLYQGRNFKSKLIADLCKFIGTKKLRTVCITPRQMASVKDLIPS